MVDFVNKLDSSDQKYLTNGIVRDESNNRKLFFTMKDFLSFGAYHQSMYLMSTILLKYKIDVLCVPQYQLTYIHNTTHTSYKE